MPDKANYAFASIMLTITLVLFLNIYKKLSIHKNVKVKYIFNEEFNLTLVSKLGGTILCSIVISAIYKLSGYSTFGLIVGAIALNMLFTKDESGKKNGYGRYLNIESWYEIRMLSLSFFIDHWKWQSLSEIKSTQKEKEQSYDDGKYFFACIYRRKASD